MLIAKSDIKLIYQNLFQEGVMVIKKDFRAPAHEEVPVQNLKVIKCLLSLKSRGYVTEQFNWQYYYYFLTDAGIEYLRGYLHLPESAVPLTIAKANKNAGRYQREGEEEGGEERRRGPRRGQQEGEYRRGGFRPSQTANA